jgi:hypothetical protein
MPSFILAHSVTPHDSKGQRKIRIKAGFHRNGSIQPFLLAKNIPGTMKNSRIFHGGAEPRLSYSNSVPQALILLAEPGSQARP